ncbi:MAG TPA: alkaline phosphatase family protein [Vicinamibacterales bacterium]|nr:alkaline phosphatase family protein [Vicinamibacterales bacterium]
MKPHSFVVIGALALCSIISTGHVTGPLRAQDTDERPKLIVVLVIDQMRTDFIDRYGQQWTGGLKRLLREGAWYRNAAYPYLNTVTCSGHATIGTGRFPRSHGVIMNSWLDRRAVKFVGCTEDPDVATVTSEGRTPGGDSGARLQGTTLAERVKDAKGRVVTIAVKPRSAIMPAGRKSDATIWFGGRGTFVTSTMYAKTLPAFAAQTLAERPITQDRATPWTKILPAEAYVGPDDGVGERPPAGWTTTFPHALDQPQFVGLWQMSPMSDAYLARLAAAAVDSYKLGQGDNVDFLSVSFSALDPVGHAFGPDSHEVQDLLARLDRTIGDLLAHLDERVGRGRYVLALTADHGVAPIPEQALANGLDAGRINGQAIANAIDRELQPMFGLERYTAAIIYSDVYFRPGVWDRLSDNARAVEVIKGAIMKAPGVDRVFASYELDRVSSDDPVQRAAALSYRRDRSGDMVLIPKRFWISSSAATTHGTLYDYDQRIPLLFFGRGVRPAQLDGPATPADIAPTLAGLAGITLKGTDGQRLPVNP